MGLLSKALKAVGLGDSKVATTVSAIENSKAYKIGGIASVFLNPVKAAQAAANPLKALVDQVSKSKGGVPSLGAGGGAQIINTTTVGKETVMLKGDRLDQAIAKVKEKGIAGIPELITASGFKTSDYMNFDLGKLGLGGSGNTGIGGGLKLATDKMFGTQQGGTGGLPTTGIMGVIKNGTDKLFGGETSGLNLPPFSINSGGGGLDLSIGASAVGKNTGTQLTNFLVPIAIIGVILWLIFKKK